MAALREFGGELDGGHVHAPIDLVSRLVLSDPKFVASFINASGLRGLESCNALSSGVGTTTGSSKGSPIRVIVNSLLIVSQLARQSGDNYPAIKDAGLMPLIGQLLYHSDDGVRSKTCNLIGNLCRHSDYFYSDLRDIMIRKGGGGTAKQGGDFIPIISALTSLTSSSSPKTRKFACFALGNAAFHSSTLYPSLRPAISGLLNCLVSDMDEKTQANAAGALGNLMRNGGGGWLWMLWIVGLGRGWLRLL